MGASLPRRIVEWKWEDLDSQQAFAAIVGFPENSETRRDVDRIVAMTGAKPGDVVLDVGCGTGRHAVELARRGLVVTGIDVADAYLEEARSQAAQAGMDCVFRTQRGSELKEEGVFDLALAIDHTLGFMDAEELAEHMGAIRRALAPNGLLLLVLAGPRLCPGGPPPPRRSWARRGDTTIATESRFDGDIRLETTIVESPDETVEYHERQRAVGHTDVLALLEHAGFAAVESFADLDGHPATAEQFGTYLSRR